MNSQISRLFFSCIILFSAHAAFAEFADIQRIYMQTPSLNQFEICQNNGCAKVSQLALSNADWQPVKALFAQLANNAEDERQKISTSIGLLEQVVGFKIGTSADLAGTFNMTSGQQDCNDEAINTTTYMRLLKQAGYMQFHAIEDLRTRNFFFNGWPHTTAVIREITSGQRFAVDSWFYDNGHPATIVPLAVWKANYKPEDSPIGKAR